jgi:protein phosphatase
VSTIKIPELSLVVLIGVTGSGKSTFAVRHFRPTEILSSDFFRGMVGDDENDQRVTVEAFEALHVVAAKRLKLGKLAVIDATNVQPDARKPLVALAREYHVLPVAIVLDAGERLCVERNRARPGRDFGAGVVKRQHSMLTRSIGRLEREGFRRVFVLRGTDEAEAAEVVREPSWTDRSADHGPFDIVGDVHGCYDELTALLGKLGYQPGDDGVPRHPAGRTAVLLGDLVDRGPAIPQVLRTVMAMVAAGTALCVAGNHEAKLLRALRGRDVHVSHGLADSLAQLSGQPEPERARVTAFLDSLLSHYVLDGGRLVVAHAGLRQEMHGRASAAVRAFALYGDTTGETDEYGLPVRYPWAEEYRGKALVVYGHTPVAEPTWVNNTICVDTGCVFGGKLTALRYPERELVSVPAARVYYQPARPLTAAPAPQRPAHGLLDVADVLGRRGVDTRLRGRVTIPEQNAAAALEVMARFAVDPRWLIYLPPAMAPVPWGSETGLLEDPALALAAYRREGIERVVCEEKHMGSRAVVIVCRTEAAARDWFGPGAHGIVYTRTGRRFFAEPTMEEALLARLDGALRQAGLWPELGDWAALDCEILPWSVKAAGLVREHYAATAAAATADLTASGDVLTQALSRGVDVAALAEQVSRRRAAVAAFAAAYRHYVWPVNSLDDIKLAPFTVLGGSAGTRWHHPHTWHMEAAERMSRCDPLVQPTRHLVAGTGDTATAEVTAWWRELTRPGGEGIVVKPADPASRGARGLPQPGLKCRGPEYLRLIYGPEYLLPGNTGRLAQRSLGRKRLLALSEFALGVEALERFVHREPLFAVHECAFGVLALESEPVDPRL